MCDPFLDLETGKIGHSISDNMLIDSDGDMLMKMSDNMAIDMNSGDLHIITSFGSSRNNDDEDD